jgi:proteasome lid subunit RPN8/RPN11
LEQLRISPALQGDGVGMLPVPRATLADMLAHVLAGYPDEACGVLAGNDGAVTAHYPTANAAATPRTFSEIAPRDLLRIWDEIETRDWQALAYYHSHPQTPAYPSSRDVLWSQGWPGTYYIIFSLAEPTAPVVRAFLITGETVREHRLTVTP